MPEPTYSLPTIGQPNSTEDPDVRTALSDLKTLLSGGLDDDNISAGSIGSDSLATNSVGADELQADSVGASEIVPLAITDAEVSLTAAILGSKLDTTDGRLKQTTGLIPATDDLSLTASWVDVPGATATIVPDVACTALVTAAFDFYAKQFVPTGLSELDAVLAGTLTVDGTEETRVARMGVGLASSAILVGQDLTVSVRTTVMQLYRISLSAASHTLKLRAKVEVGEANLDTKTCNEAGTQFSYQLVAQ